MVPPGTVRVLEATGALTNWYRGELEPARLLDASFSADGRSIWLLLERIDGAHHVADVARMDTPGKGTIVASTDLGEDVAHLWFEGFAPDDSTIAIGHWTGELGGTTESAPLTLMRMSDGTSDAHPGTFAGYAPAAVTDAWPASAGPRP